MNVRGCIKSAFFGLFRQPQSSVETHGRLPKAGILVYKLSVICR